MTNRKEGSDAGHDCEEIGKEERTVPDAASSLDVPTMDELASVPAVVTEDSFEALEAEMIAVATVIRDARASPIPGGAIGITYGAAYEWADRLRALVEKELETAEKALYDQGCEYTTAFHSFTADLLELKAALAAKIKDLEHVENASTRIQTELQAALAAKTEELERMFESRLQRAKLYGALESERDTLKADNDRLRAVMLMVADDLPHVKYPPALEAIAARLREEAGK